VHLKHEGEEDLGGEEGVVACFVGSFTDGVSAVSWVKACSVVSNRKDSLRKAFLIQKDGEWRSGY
jgi:hypothetical protein